MLAVDWLPTKGGQDWRRGRPLYTLNTKFWLLEWKLSKEQFFEHLRSVESINVTLKVFSFFLNFFRVKFYKKTLESWKKQMLSHNSLRKNVRFSRWKHLSIGGVKVHDWGNCGSRSPGPLIQPYRTPTSFKGRHRGHFDTFKESFKVPNYILAGIYTHVRISFNPTVIGSYKFAPTQKDPRNLSKMTFFVYFGQINIS